MTLSSKKAENVSLVSFFLSIVFFLIPFFLGKWSDYIVAEQLGWFFLAAALIWGVLWVYFRHRQLAEQEKLDMRQMQQNKADTTIFEAGGHKELFTEAQRRLGILEKWFLPIFSALIAIYQVGIGIFLYLGMKAEFIGKPSQPLVCAAAMTGLAFVSFLMSRYAAGMSAQEQWKHLRSGASFLLWGALLSFVLAIGFAFEQFNIDIILRVTEYVIPISLIVLGAENGLNIIFDIYRPRVKGKHNRTAFDSRLLGIINEPGGILHTAASTIDYQFGFKVSQTWFYKLLEKAIVPLTILTAVILYSMSCIVIVDADQQAIIEHFGNPRDANGDVRLIGPGLTWKMPWPIDIAYKYPTGKIDQLTIGYIPKEYEPGERREALIWGKTHYIAEFSLLVASGQSIEQEQLGAVPVSLVTVALPVQYRVKNLYDFMYTHKDSKAALEDICYRELTKFGASATIEVDEEYDIEKSLLGAGRSRAKDILADRIQKAADSAKLGVEVVFVGFEGLHPPVDVAADYQKMVASVQQKRATILKSLAERNMTLSSLAGSTARASDIYDLAVRYQKAKENDDAEVADKLAIELDKAFSDASGDIFVTLSESRSYAFERSLLAKAVGLRFANQLKAYTAAPEFYLKDQRLKAFEESLNSARKYVVAADSNDSQVFIVDISEKLTPGLLEMEGFEENSEK
ncbi:MAG: hypothetical protein ISS77_02790 [Phycisphaerae bacterium]|nr:hypothetical protein [Phycisphaerae bacterium]